MYTFKVMCLSNTADYKKQIEFTQVLQSFLEIARLLNYMTLYEKPCTKKDG